MHEHGTSDVKPARLWSGAARGVALALTLLPLLLAGGCGGSGRGGGESRDAGVATFVIDVLAPSRVLPLRATYLKIEIFDVAIASNNQPKNVRIPIRRKDESGAILPDSLEDAFLIERGKEQRRQYVALPIKNLTARISAYAEDPVAISDVSRNPPLAVAEQSFTPSVVETSAQPVVFTLSNQVTTLEIEEKSVAVAGDPSRPALLTATAKVNNVTALIAPETLTWTLSSPRPGIPITGIANIRYKGQTFNTTVRIAEQAPPNNDSIEVVGLGNDPSSVEVTVRYQEPGFPEFVEGRKVINIITNPGYKKLEITARRPVGTQAIRVTFTNLTNGNRTTVQGRWDLRNEQPSLSTLQLEPGDYQVLVEAFSGIAFPQANDPRASGEVLASQVVGATVRTTDTPESAAANPIKIDTLTPNTQPAYRVVLSTSADEEVCGGAQDCDGDSQDAVRASQTYRLRLQAQIRTTGVWTTLNTNGLTFRLTPLEQPDSRGSIGTYADGTDFRLLTLRSRPNDLGGIGVQVTDDRDNQPLSLKPFNITIQADIGANPTVVIN